MNWCSLRTKDGKVDKYAMASQCGSFTICRVTVMGRESFELWKGKEFVSRHTNPDEARSAASVTRTETVANV